MISVSIVEDDSDIRNGITRYLSSQPGFKVLSFDPTAELFLARLEDGPRPDIVLMDIQLPGMSGIDGIRILKRKWPEIDIAMLTVYHDEEKIFQSLCAGASGYLLKNTPLVELKNALTELNAGG
ncbi:MAG TPA: response regulator transcription factor, partial [bacterium]|nr:response regulator transcription factor [bacterium]